MVRSASLGALLAGVAWSAALAQAPAPVQPGQRVRVQSTVAHTPVLIGAVEAIGADTLVVRHDDGAGAGVATAIPLSSIARLQVSRGRHSKWLTGLVLGAGVGAAAGAIIGAATHDENDFLFSAAGDAVLGAIVLTPVGALTGMVIGLLVKTERWRTVPLERVSPRVAWGPTGRLSVGVRIAL
jgi:hypothetical protein